LNHQEIPKNKQKEKFYYDHTTQQLSQVCVVEVKVLLREKERKKNPTLHTRFLTSLM